MRTPYPQILSLLVLLPIASCYSTGGGDHNSGGSVSYAGSHSSGGTTSTGGTYSSGGSFFTGGASSGGSISSGGTYQCGECPAVACLAGVELQIAPDPAVAPANISGVTVEGDGLTFTCYASSDCSVYCQNTEYTIPDGHHTLTVSAPGFQPQVVEFDAVNPTDCGCCGCCPFSYYGQVTLTSDGSAVETCCADTQIDALNCGACNHACANGASCVAGECQPGFGACLTSGLGYTTCTDYCTATGQVCADACGVSVVASEQWLGEGNCPDVSTIYGGHDCDAAFDWGMLPTPNSYRCCCASP